MTNSPLKLSPVLLTAAFLVSQSVASVVWADDDEEEIPFTVANVLVQLNDTDGDLGFHARIDGEAWKKLKIENPRERTLLKIRNSGSLRRQGLTELAFESAEPTFDELSPEAFFARFPEGEYEISGVTIDGEEMESTAVFTHVIPAPPKLVAPLPSADCDLPDTPPVNPDGSVTIDWDPVSTSHPEIGASDPFIEITGYELTVEREEPAPTLVFEIALPAAVTAFDVPASFIGLGTTFKYQVLVGEASGNETSSENCFAIAS